MEQKKYLKTTDLTKIALLAALLSASSYISIPLPLIPITAQTIVINLIALILEPLQTAIAVGTWILLGAAGLPVFSGGTGGVGKLFGPTGGYILGYLLAAVLISFLKGKKNQIVRYCVVTIVAGMPVIYLVGTLYMKFLTKMDWKAAFVSGVVPFIPGDILKCIVASIIAVALNKALVVIENRGTISGKSAKN